MSNKSVLYILFFVLWTVLNIGSNSVTRTQEPSICSAGWPISQTLDVKKIKCVQTQLFIALLIFFLYINNINLHQKIIWALMG